MATLNQFLYALNSDNAETREAASRVLLREFKKSPSDLPVNLIATIANRLNDDSELVRENVSEFILEYAKSGRNLDQAWLNVVAHLNNSNANVRQRISESLSYLGQSEQKLRTFLDNSALPERMRFYASEALTHFYLRQKYFSSLNELLKKEPIILNGVFRAIEYDRRVKVLGEKDFMSLVPRIRESRNRVIAPVKAVPKRELPRKDLRDRQYARA